MQSTTGAAQPTGEASSTNFPAAAASEKSKPLARAVLVALGFLATCWLGAPALWSGHLEAITVNLKLMAIEANRGDFLATDPLSPLIAQYHYGTRLGVVLLFQAIDALFGETGDGGFRASMIASLIVVVAASAYVARRWGKAGVAAVFAAIALTPGVFETAFFFNDNLISAAFALLALAAISKWSHPAAYVGAGALYAYALLCRTDAVFLAPVLAGVGWIASPRLFSLLKRAGSAVVGACATLLPVYLATHVSPLDAIPLAQLFKPPSHWLIRLMLAGYFFGVPTLLLLATAFAEWRKTRNGRWWLEKRNLVFAIYPAFAVAVAAGLISSEVRYIYPLFTPVIAMHAGRGLEILVARLFAGGPGAVLARFVVAPLLCLALVAPPSLIRVQDGPRAYLGRLWTPLLWMRWQAGVQRSMDRIGDLVAATKTVPTTVVLSVFQNDEFFFKLRMIEDGYEIRSSAEALPGCAPGFTVFERSGHRVLHIRSGNLYRMAFGAAPQQVRLVRAIDIDSALRCPAVRRADRMYLTTVGKSFWNDYPDTTLFEPVLRHAPPVESFSQSFDLKIAQLVHPWRFEPARLDTERAHQGEEVQVFPMTPGELAEIGVASTKIVAKQNATIDDVLNPGRGRFAFRSVSFRRATAGAEAPRP